MHWNTFSAHTSVESSAAGVGSVVVSRPSRAFSKRTGLFFSAGLAFGLSSLYSAAILADSTSSTPAADRYAVASVKPSDTSLPALTSVSDLGERRSAPVVKAKQAFNTSQVDRIRMRVWGSNDLSGEYAIDPDNSMSIPRLGRIEVGGMSMAELEVMLARKLSSIMRTDVTVAIEVANFRPYYIMGHVAEPGAIEWRPGLKVIQAISLARGVLRTETAQAVSGTTGQQSRTQLTFALAQLARLKAEREGGEVVASKERIAHLISTVPETNRLTLTNLMNRQNDMLEEQRQIMDAQLVGFRRERETAERELDALKSQEQFVRAQVDITRAQLSGLEELKEKKLVANARFLEQKSDLMQIEVRYAEIKSQLERAQARLTTIDQQIVIVPQQRRAELSERIDTLEREVAQLELVSGVTDSAQDDQNNVLKLTYHISRESAAGVQTIPATVFTEILPGDVLIVSDGSNRVDSVSNTLDSQPHLPLRDGSEKDANAGDAQRLIEDAAIDPSQMLRRASDMRR